jgi:hypothetical protein
MTRLATGREEAMGTRRVVVAVSLALLALVLVEPSARAAELAGFSRIKVKEAGISIAIPDTYTFATVNREQARAIVEANPQRYPDPKAGVESLMSAPLVAGVDDDRDGYSDASVGVAVIPGIGRLPTRSQVESDMRSRADYSAVTTHRATLNGKPAIVTEFVEEKFRLDGILVRKRAVAYTFLTERGVIDISFGEDFDRGHRDEFDTMIRSVKRL